MGRQLTPQEETVAKELITEILKVLDGHSFVVSTMVVSRLYERLDMVAVIDVKKRNRINRTA